MAKVAQKVDYAKRKEEEDKKIEEAMKAREERNSSSAKSSLSSSSSYADRKKELDSQINTAMASRSKRIESSLPDVVSDIEKNLTVEIDSYNKTKKPAFGSYADTYNSQRERRLNISSLRNKVKAYSSYMKGVDTDGILAMLDEMEKGYDSYLYLSKFKTEDDYNKAKKEAEAYEAMPTYDTKKGAKEIAELEKAADADIKEYWNLYDLRTQYSYGATLGQPDDISMGIEARMQEILDKYGAKNIDDIQNQITQKKAYLTQAERLQEGLRLGSVGDKDSEYYDPEYAYWANTRDKLPTREDLVAYDSMMDQSKWYTDASGKLYDAYGTEIDPYNTDGKGKILHPSQGSVDTSDKLGIFLAASEEDVQETAGTYLNTGGTWETIVAEGSQKHWDRMEESEINTYYYYLNKNGSEAAEKYLDSIQETLNRREGTEKFKTLEDKTALELLFGVAAGLDQFGSGLQGLRNAVTGNDEYIPTTATQYASSMVREDLGDVGFKLPEWMSASADEYGNPVRTSIAQAGYDSISTTTNMLPSIITSVAVNAIAPGAGGAVGTALLSASAGGSAYTEMINFGYDKNQARTYGIMVGASEAILQELLGGISQLGGGMLSKGVTKALGKADNVLAKIAIKFGNSNLGRILINAAEEGSEEYLQAILEPWFKNIIFGEENEIDLLSEEALYSALLGALTGGMFEGAGVVSDKAKENSMLRDVGKDIIEADGGVDALKSLAMDVSGANPKLAKQTNKVSSEPATGTNLVGKAVAAVKNSINQKQVGKLYQAVTSEVSAQNQADIAKALSENGFSKSSAKNIAEAVVAKINGEDLNNFQKATLESVKGNKKVDEIVNGILKDAESAMNKRDINLARYNLGISFGVGIGPESASTNQAGQGKEIGSAEGNLATSAKTVSEGSYEVSAEGKTMLDGHEVNLNGLVKTSDGAVMVATADNQTADPNEVVYPTKGHALVYENYANIETTTSNPVIANMPVSDRSELAKQYSPTSGVEAKAQFLGLNQAYWYGFEGISMDENTLPENSLVRSISEEQRAFAYELGQKAGKAAALTQSVGIESAYQKAIEKLGGKEAAKAVAKKNKGKVILESGVRKSSMTPQQKGTVSLAKVVAEATGVDIHVYHGVKEYGKWDSNSGEIWLNVNAMFSGQSMMAFTLGHELVHMAKQWSAVEFKEFADYLLSQYGKKGVSVETLISDQMENAKLNGYELNEHEAYEEVICDACQRMLLDSDAISKMAAFKAQNPTRWQQIVEAIKEFIAKIRKWFEGAEPDSTEAALYKEFDDAVKEHLENKFVEMVMDAGEHLTTIRNAFGKGTVVEVNENGEFTLAKGEDSNGATKFLYNDYTWENGGRETLATALKAEGFTQEDIDAALTIMDGKHNLVKELAKEFPEQDRINQVTITTDLKDGHSVLSALVSNGDYPVNIDLLMVCKKRKAYQRVINRLCETGLIQQATVDALAIAEINKILGKYGFETACLGCFVESRRLRIQEWAETICKEWNAEVKKRNPNAKAFGFGKGKATLTPDEVMQLVGELESGGPKNEKGNLNLGQGSAVKRMGVLLDKVPALRKTLAIEDLITPEGLSNLRRLDSNLFSMVKSRYGSNSPKFVQEFNPYNHELAKYGKVPSEYKSLREYLYAIGGARMQSFSDFIVENWFDYCQIVADLATRKLPMHTYTKEIALAKLFGLTGIKINMSLIPDIDRSLGKEYAGLTRNSNGELELIWADKDRFKTTGGKSYMQSINFNDAIALQNDPRYSANVGTIAVGVSDRHILMMLDDPRIRMVIPYHSSGMNPIFADLMGTSFYKDYTMFQNTTVKQIYNSKGQKVSLKLDKTQTGKLTSGFQFNEVLQELGDARAAAQAYKDWCADASKHTITIKGETYTAELTPKFDDFSGHENYYKLLEDFNTYDCISEQAAPQGDVQQNYPEDFDKILKDELKSQEGHRQKQVANQAFDKAMGEIETYLKSHTKADTVFYAEQHGVKLGAKDKKLGAEDKKKLADLRKGVKNSMPKVRDAEYLDAVKRGDMETAQLMVIEAARAAGYTSPMLFHGTSKFGFTKFDPAFSDDKMSIFLSSNNLVAETYSGKTEKYKVSQKAAITPEELDKASPETILKLLQENVDYRIEMIGEGEMKQIINKHRSELKNAIRMAEQVPVLMADKWNGSAQKDLDKVIASLRNLAEASGYNEFMDAYDDYEGALFDMRWENDAATNVLYELIRDDVNSAYRGLTNYIGTTLYRGNTEYTKRNGKDIFNINEAVSELYKVLYRGVYQLYTNPGNQLVINAEGSNWNQIDGKLIGSRGPVRTRDVAKYAKENGYDSVLIKNLRDSGDYSYMGQSDVYIFFGGDRLKSADPVTYDDSGNVIPLSERFNPVNKDIRYSMPKAKAPTFYSQMAKVVDGMKQEKFGASSVISMLRDPKRGVRAEEIKWSGIETWLEGKKSVTKAELQEFIAGSMLQIDEEILDYKERPYTEDQQKRLDEYSAKREEIAKRLADEWKKLTGVEFPIHNIGANLESAVVKKIIATNLDHKNASFEGRLLAKLKKDLQKVIENNDDFGFDSWDAALNNIHRRRRSFLDHYEMSTSDKAVIVKYCNALNAYNELPRLISEDEANRLRAIAREATPWDRKIMEVKKEYNDEAEKYMPRWGSQKHNLKGGKNYREVLFRIPGSTYTNKDMFTHWENRAGVLAHARIQDFDTSLGRMLFVEELQSDWHNNGLKYFYEMTQEEEDQKRQDLLQKKRAAESELESVISAMDRELKKMDLAEMAGEPVDDSKYTELAQKQYKLRERIVKAKNRLDILENDRNKRAPHAPFADKYHEYVMKRLLRMAAEEGYDSIGWTTADTQSKRWDSKFAEAYTKEYDRDIPKFLSKYCEKWGATVGKTVLDNGTEVWSVAITDSMKESVLYEGQPKYSMPKVIEKPTDNKYISMVENGATHIGEYDIVPKEAEPKRTILAWKALVVKPGAKNNPNNKGYGNMYPPQVHQVASTPYGVWLYANEAPKKLGKDGKPELTKYGRPKVKEGMTYRPAWHFGDVPYASQFRSTHGFFDDNGVRRFYMSESKGILVWALCEMAADENYQDEADMAGHIGENRYWDEQQASLWYLPENGYYKYMTNRVDPNSVTWYLSDKMRIVQTITDAEMRDILTWVKEDGATDLEFNYPLRIDGKDVDPADYGIPVGNVVGDGIDYVDRWKNQFREIALNGEIDITQSHFYYVPSTATNYGSYETVSFGKEVDDHSQELIKTKKDAKILFVNSSSKSAIIQDFEASTGVKAKDAKTVAGRKKIIEAAKNEGYDIVEFAKEAKGLDADVVIVNPDSVIRNYKFNNVSERHGRTDAVKYSNPKSSGMSSRQLLADAFDELVQTPDERELMAQYRANITKVDEVQDRLQKVRGKIRELTESKGDKKKIAELNKTAADLADLIDKYDRKLLRLEASEPLRDVLSRAKSAAYKKAKERSEKTMKEYRQQVSERFDRGVEGRRKTEMRHKVQNVVKELNDLLLNESKKRHVPDNLKKAVAGALSIVNMDTVDAEERAAKYAALIAKEQAKAEPDQDKIDSYTTTMENILRQGEKMGQRLKELRDAYEEISESDDPDIANAYDPVIAGAMKELSQTIGNTSIRNMTLDQLSDVYDMYRMVLTRVRDANKTLLDNIKESISNLASRVIVEVRVTGGEHTYRAAMLDPVRKFLWNNLKPVYAMEWIGSSTLTKVFDNVRAGEDVWAKDVVEAREYYLDKSKKYGYDSWDFKKKHRFESASGLEFELTLEQILSLYAYSKREQAHDHLKLGGFVFDSDIETYKDKGSKLIKYKVNTADAHQISPEILAGIIGTLTDDQKGFVDDMQDYLSTVMGAKGNEVTSKMYGVKLFKEKFYFPLKSAKQFMFEQNEVSGEVKIKNSGFTNKVVAKANNPVILSNFMDVWAGHVNDMSMYHAFTLPLEDFNRVFNYNSPKKEGQPPVSVKGTIQGAYSPAAVHYVKNLITDLNGGARTDPTTGFINKMMGLFKKGSVFASMSVVVQQPSAIARAAALLDTKYFIGPKVDHKRHKALWDELKQYAPVAIIKEMGYFDTNMGKSTQNFILGKEYSGFKDKMKALFADGDYRDEALSKAPALADEIAWCSIWEAVKRETKANYPGLDAKGEPFLKLCGSRFTEVIVKTQVYDSVLSRSGNMRSKDTGMKMATAFMAEPTTSINMITDALLQGKRGNRKYARKAIGAVIAAQILNSILVSFVYAGRDDDEEKTYAEKYIGTITGEILDSLNPAGYIPFIKDIMSIVQGYDVERSDMAVIADLWKAWENLSKDNVSPYRKVEGFAGSIAQIFGLPVKNIMRDARSIYQTVDSFVNGEQTTKAGIGYAVKAVLPKWIGGGEASKEQQLYEAILSGDQVQIARVKGRYANEKAVNTAMRSAIKDHFLAGDIDSETALKYMVNYCGDEEDEAFWKVEEWTYDQKADDAFSKYNEFYGAVQTGKDLKAIIKKYTDNGVTERTLKSQISDHFKDDYIKMSTSERASIKGYLLNAMTLLGDTREEAEKRISGWEFEANNGFNYEDRRELYLKGEITGDQIRDAVMTYGGKTAEEADEEVEKLLFEAEYGYAYSDRGDLYKNGEISAEELKHILMTAGGKTAEEADFQIQAYDWEAQGYEDVTPAAVRDYNEHCQATDVPKDVYLHIRSFANNTENDVDKATGKTIYYSAMKKIMAEINAQAGLTSAQKTAIARSLDWAEKNINKYKLW